MEPTKTSVEELSESRRRLDVEIAARDVQAEYDKAFALVGREARLPGFRPGKAPRSILEKRFGEQIRREVVGRLVEETFHQAIHDHKLAVVGSPEIDADTLTPGQALKYSATIDVRPVITVGDVDGLEVTRPEVTVTDEDVDRVVGQLQESVAQLRPIDDRTTVEAGDMVTVNLTSRIDGGEPVQREGVMLEAGAGEFALAPERQIVGQERGARLTIQVPYPEDYGNEALAGKTADIDLELLDLRLKEVPPLDDDFARDHGHCDSMEALRTRMREDLERRAGERADAAVREALVEQLVGRHTFEVPQSLVDRRCDAMLASLNIRMPEGGAPSDALQRLRDQLRPRAEHEIQAELLLDEIAQRDGIEIADEDVRSEIDGLAAREGQAPERVRALYDRPEARAAISARLARQRVVERLLDTAKIVPVEASGDVAREKGSR